MSEQSEQDRIRDAANMTGGYLWRNNSGAFDAGNKRWVRYGLGNDSMRVNKVFKSSDLIGLTPRTITHLDVGRLYGIFTAVEVKPQGWTLQPSDAHAHAQLNYINTVLQCGGFAGFATSVEQYKELIR